MLYLRPHGRLTPEKALMQPQVATRRLHPGGIEKKVWRVVLARFGPDFWPLVDFWIFYLKKIFLM